MNSDFIQSSNRRFVRFLEIMPAVISLSALILPVLLARPYPFAVGTFMVIFAALWFTRAIEFSVCLVYSFIKFKKAEQIDWQKKINNFENNHNLSKKESKIREILKKDNNLLSFKDLTHLVIIPTYKEDITVLRSSVESIKESDFDNQQIMLCIATEERDHDRGLANALIIEKEYGNLFKKFFHFEHPDGIEGEIKGKGGNITYSGRKIAEILNQENYDFSKIICTTLDADNCVHRQYFHALSYAYITEINRKHKSYQPLPFYFNNIWDVPLLNRVVSLSSSFWHMIENGRPSRLRNFASHAQPFEALAEMDFWSVKTIVEDGHQFWRSYLHFRGNYSVVPIFIPIYLDAFQGADYFRSLKGQFLQLRRWAWGVTDVPFMVVNWIQKRKELPFWLTLCKFWRLFEGHFMWATAPILITLTTPIPSLLNADFQDTVFAVNSAILIATIFRCALLGLSIAMAVSFLLMPKPKKLWQKFSIFWQWAFLPIVTVVFASMSALSAQIILALGKKLEFNVTPKIRIENK